jgi:hypothetical protein
MLPAQVALLNGYLQAAQGRCGQAEKYFQEAMTLGQTCVPKKYREGCDECRVPEVMFNTNR